MKTILVTGGAGFIGSSLIDKLLIIGDYKIICLDNFDDFYNRAIKEKNISNHIKTCNYQLIETDINNRKELFDSLDQYSIDIIIHLAAKGGVRPSIVDPESYFKTNVLGTLNVLELAKEKKVMKFIFASSSSVYGRNPNVPWREDDLNLEPISPYASSKIAAEKVCQTYAYLYNINIAALRFFTVYGPKQRPDLAIHKFFRLAMENNPITFYGNGETRRDYTFIDDIVEGIISTINFKFNGFEIFNLGNNHTVSLSELILEIEKVIGRKLILETLPKQAGDVDQTSANIDKAISKLNYHPKTKLEVGLREFYNFFKHI